MSLPSPTDRRETYLNAIATGNSSDLPTPSTREEIYLDYIAKNGGGGGGTSNYEQLSNKPQINGVTLSGNKSADDLNLASKTDVTGKADKVTNATSGHLAGLDSNGNLTDSGVSPTEDVTVEGNPVTFVSPFEQDAKSVVVSVKPIQDLHGYDHPWPAGGGKNKFNKNGSLENGKFIQADGTLISSSNWNTTDYQQITPNTYTMSGATEGEGGYYGICWYDSEKTYISGFQIFDTSPQTVTIPSNAQYVRYSVNNSALDSFMLEQGSVATSYAPYSNICTISGIDEVEIGVSGKNLLSINKDTCFYRSGTFTKVSDNSLTITRMTFGASNIVNVIHPVEHNTDYAFDFVATEGIFAYGMKFVDEMPTQWQNMSNMVRSGNSGSNNYVVIGFEISAGNTSQVETISNLQLEYGSTPTEFEPYIESTTTIPLPSTLYGGDVDVTEGSADSRSGIVDLGDLTWINRSELRAGLFSTVGISDYKYAEDIISSCECYDFDGVVSSGSVMISKDYGKYCFYYSSSDMSTRALFVLDATKASMTGEQFAQAVDGIKLVYELATPTTISFDPTDVELLEGTNVVTTNAEKVAVTYGRSLWQDIGDLKTDTEGKLDKSDVADVEGDTASKAYSVNEFMLRSDGLYKVTQPIAQNASITASNTTKTTIGAVLTALLNA